MIKIFDCIDQNPFFFMTDSILPATYPCLADSWFLTIPGMFPLRSASEIYVTLVWSSSILSRIYPPMYTSPLTTPFTSGWGNLQALVPM